jgi:hypothetical protein
MNSEQITSLVNLWKITFGSEPSRVELIKYTDRYGYAGLIDFLKLFQSHGVRNLDKKLNSPNPPKE